MNMRVTVNLTSAASAAMERTMKRTGQSKTQAVNAGLVRADFFEEQIAAGRAILVEDENGDLERIHLL